MQKFDKNIELPEPWYWTNQNLSGQLEKEIGKSHILFDKKVKTLARRQDNDDVLFLVEDNSFAVVHLTWSNNSHYDGQYPITLEYDSWEELYENRILKDKEEFE
ncbi:hypothetical protein [Flagellimonas sp. S3867]|uniref:hypothetical protein n=1 Tax=Flagellimonas sp. S3867 TaxID=2768063 RepID=UPI0016845FAE|nr:hypothetical protein [Flagellimonas sp. S3867]